MRPLILPLALFGFAIFAPGIAYSSGVGKLVTKATQKELGLEFELSATREPDAVIVRMTVPKNGKLKDLRQVRLSILAENQKDFLVLAPLDMRAENGGLRVSAQLAPEFAAKATLDLVVEEGRRESFYSVKVADYIMERNNKEAEIGFDIRALDGSVLIPSAAIIGYEWATHTLILKEGTRDRLRKELFGAAKPLTIPITACVAGKPVYEGQFVSPASSRSSDKVSLVLDFDPLKPDRVWIQRGYAIDESKLAGKDPRPDARIKKSLEAVGKLK
jgi:hypothetical protein